MSNIIDVIRKQISETVTMSLNHAIEAGTLPAFEIPEVTVEIPRDRAHGDFATNIAMQATKIARTNPRKIAETVIAGMNFKDTYLEAAEIAGPGFINFRLNRQWMYDAMATLDRMGAEYGAVNVGEGKKVMVEFVSANPTGPLHMGNARGGALGDLIASVLTKAGYDVTREFYVNDAGNQIEKFGLSLEARFLQQVFGEDHVSFPEDGYHGEDIREHAADFIAAHGDSLKDAEPSERRRALVAYALPRNLSRIREGLAAYGVEFDNWYSEKQLHESGAVQTAIDQLKSTDHAFDQEGATWFKATGFGSDKDDVLVRGNGVPTYFAADIAYHYDKFITRKYDWCINLWGADHHGHVARMKAAMDAVGVNPDRLDIVLFQLVRLYRNGEVARMSKRTGRTVSISDLIEEVGRDAVRFFFNMKASGSHLDFDLDLASKQSSENPVFYVQYAHARICSMIRLLESDGHQLPAAGEVNLDLLSTTQESELMRRLAEYPEEIRISASTLEPSRLTRYIQEVAAAFHAFYTECRIKGEAEELLRARLFLAGATRTVLKNVLDLLKVSAPERM